MTKYFLKLLLLCLVISFFIGPSFGIAGKRSVVVYTSVDQIFSQPVFRLYEKNTGVKVKAVFDVEASKTVGLVNRIVAEKNHPIADVFWNSEIGRTIALKKMGVLASYQSPAAKNIPIKFKDPEGYWTGFATRGRVIIYNVDLVSEQDVPRSIFELTEPEWKGKVAMGYPLLGTIATHMSALNTILGQRKLEKFLSALKENKILIVPGNSVVRDVVADGEMPVGITDTDDVNVAIQLGKPVKMIYPDQDGMGMFLIPNTVALIKNCPHPEEGKKMIDFLLSNKVESWLSFSQSANIPVRDGTKAPLNVPKISNLHVMDVDYNKTGQNMKKTDILCQRIFTE